MMDDSMWRAVFYYFVENGTSVEPPYYCSSDQCNWPDYETLGVCSSCIDISAELTFSCQNEPGDWLSSMGSRFLPKLPNETNYPGSISCGYFMDVGDSGSILMTGYSLNASTSQEALLLRYFMLQDDRYMGSLTYNWTGFGQFDDIQNPLEHFIVAAVPDAAAVYANSTPVAQECMLSWCAKTISPSFSNGQYQETIRSTVIETNSSKVLDQITAEMTAEGPEYFDWSNVTVHGANPGTTYEISNTSQAYIGIMFDYYLPAFLTSANLSAQPQLRIQNFAGYVPVMTQYPYNPWAPPNNISGHVDRLATALTNIIRTPSSNNNTENVFGSRVPETYIQINWHWFSLPIILLLSTLAFLLATIRKAATEHNGVIWKSSSLATLTNGLSDATKIEVGPPWHLVRVRETAENTYVRLRVTKQGCTLEASEEL